MDAWNDFIPAFRTGNTLKGEQNKQNKLGKGFILNLVFVPQRDDPTNRFLFMPKLKQKGGDRIPRAHSGHRGTMFSVSIHGTEKGSSGEKTG